MFREPWRTRLLFVSLAGNLFLAGLIGAQWVHRPPHGHGGPEGGLERMAHDLPPADAERFRTAMAVQRPQREQARARMETARMALSTAIARTPYDEGVVRKSMQDWQAAWIEWSNQFGGSMLSALSTLSPDGRARLAEAGRHPPPPPQ